jgi:hypothetical protein
MKKFLAALLTASLALTLCSESLASNGNIYFDMPIKQLLAEPSLESNLNYEIPIDVTLLAVSADKKWVKVKIAFDLIFLGHYEYTGWTYVPKMKDYILKEVPSEEIPAE